ncbi:hypothetical protein F4774DRAFT_304217 [Daldinia eschscholtzii]|nr:hypothetical protein F4774DRAFT_304217 [Daldinia eschscholtzii]
MASPKARKSRKTDIKPACDRCRGQKLRCIWDGDTKCRRCTRADSVCIVAARRRQGRPPKGLSDSNAESMCSRSPAPSVTSLMSDVLDWRSPLTSSAKTTAPTTGVSSKGFAPLPTTTKIDNVSIEGNASYVKELSDVQVAIINHPLHDDSATNQIRVAELQLGQLFTITSQLRDVTKQVISLTPEDISHRALRDNATVLLVLSCYSRLDFVYARAVDILRDVQSSNQNLDDSYQLISGFSIDGFSLDACKEFQISFVLQLCEQIRQRLNVTIEGLRGNVEYPNRILV